MISGTLFSIVNSVRFVPILCSFSTSFLHSILWTQAVFMGFYQISKLYYCFSQNQIYSKKGYPNWLFIIMYIIGIFIFLSGWSYPYFAVSLNLHCGINKKL